MPLEEFDPSNKTLEFDYQLFSARYKGDDRLYVRFFVDVLLDEARSAEEGRPCFREAVLIQIMVPGDKNHIVIREARDEDKRRFPNHYSRFKAGQAEQSEGYPLKEWPMVTRAMVEELKYFGFTTVEQIEKANDSICQKMPGLRELQNRARNWLEARNSSAPLQKLEAENRSLQEQVNSLMMTQQEMIKEMAQMKKEKTVA